MHLQIHNSRSKAAIDLFLIYNSCLDLFPFMEEQGLFSICIRMLLFQSVLLMIVNE